MIATSGIGTMLEYYDFFVYVALTATLTHLFLPTEDKVVATLLGAATFGISYVARPLGTVIFSPLSDRIGRKKTFVVTLVVMGAATVAIGCLPTYSAIGVWAPAALLTLRIIQGIALGGEYASAVVYLVEQSPRTKRGLITSILQSTASLGLLLALALSTLLKGTLPEAAFETWGWRIPFLVSAPIVAVATVVRMNMRETPTFLALKETGQLAKSPLSTALKGWEAWKSILLATFGAQGATSVSLYTSIVYMLYFLGDVVKADTGTANLCLGAGILIAAPFYPVFGRLSDRVGRSRVMAIGIALWMCVAYPAFAGIRSAAASQAWVLAAALITVLAVLTAMIMAPLPAFISERFPSQTRTTGFGIAQQLGNILFGGFLPLIALSLVNLTGNPLAGVLYSIVSLAPCLLVTVLWGLKHDRPVPVSSHLTAPDYVTR
ncbi:MFS transporter [Streptomyces brasiliensis]|uniref:MFS transporter n=1 Tax=Streptomyces brasiliensis TaxID=1954 RepID=A0A917NKV6_9ACTN|nr:MFS transporter [Streptomyces brasiliensis]GGJ08042.1 MFS transporter [Streptomyces brasiliensis]